MNKEEIRQFKSLLKQGSLRHMNIILDDKFQKSLLEIIKDYDEKDKQITQLTNNWNELEELISNLLKEADSTKSDLYIYEQNKAIMRMILDNMKEIKEKNNER